MTGRRAAFLIEVDLDPIPGFGHTRQSWRDWLAALLDRSAGHYQPTVTEAARGDAGSASRDAECAYLWDRLTDAYELLAEQDPESGPCPFALCSCAMGGTPQCARFTL
jgi:hypothetical protein